ncbi:MAG: protein translocase subunit SecD, partial [Lentisphaerae bacterium]
MKKSIFWRFILTVAVLAAWSSLLFPLRDRDYVTTFKSMVTYPAKKLDNILKDRLRRQILEDAQKEFVAKQKNPAWKTFDALPEQLQQQFYRENSLKIQARVEKTWKEWSSEQRAKKREELRKELQTKLDNLLKKAQELYRQNEEAAQKSEIEHAKDPSKPLVARKSIETIILELASGRSGVPGFSEYLPLSYYIVMHSKEHPTNEDIVYFVRNRSRSRIKLGLDLRGGTEFTLTFDLNELKALNQQKAKEAGRKLSAEEVRDRIIEVLRNRIDPQGVREVEIRPNGSSSITIRTPITDPAEIAEMKRMLEQQAKLNFYLVHPDNDRLIREGRTSVPGYKRLPLRNRSHGDSATAARNYIWVKSEPEKVNGEHVVAAYPSRDKLGQWLVVMKFNSRGASYMQGTTSNNIGKRMAIVLDNVVYSAPVIQGAISANGEITGNFTQQEAQQLATVLQSGSLPVKIRIDSQMITSPTLGKEYIRSGLTACIWGMILVVAFMIFYYRLGGVVADLALLANILLIFGTLPLVNAALTLPGIAGIVLTVGMAVDANVLIFERIREELVKGRRIASAIKNGYAQAFWTIFDANITTLVTAFFLYQFGSGTIKGFAVTLSIGIIASMFTALFVTRWILDFLVEYKILTKPTMLHSFLH